MSEFNREPCFWTSDIPGYNTKDRQRTFMRHGEVITERFPQRGHLGDYEHRLRAPGDRFLRLVDHYGNEIFHTLTNAAAHLDSNTGWGQYQKAKARHFGWFMPGACPCALLTTGELTTDHIVSPEVRKGTPCSPKSYSYENRCPHSIAEQTARQTKNAEVQAKREEAMKGEAAKHMEATQAMAKQLADAVTTLIAAQAEKKSGK